jgi:hypothetical protein
VLTSINFSFFARGVIVAGGSFTFTGADAADAGAAADAAAEGATTEELIIFCRFFK